MAPKKPLLEQMRTNPSGDWTIGDIAALCDQTGVQFIPPSRGSHYKVSSPVLYGHLTIPSKRPIKAFYIKNLVSMIDEHIKASKEEREGQ